MSGWPRLDYRAEKGVYETVHLYLQLVGKLPLRLHPWINHGWHVALKVSPRGFITRRMPAGGRSFTVEFDCCDEVLDIRCDRGDHKTVALHGQPLCELHRELSEALTSLDLPAPLHGKPNEIADPIAFSRDTRPRPWDGAVVRRLHAAFASVDEVFAGFRAPYRGKSSPSHLFWGSFDLAVTRFSGRSAPPHPGGIPNLSDAVTREAYSEEVISAGFWLGGSGVEEAAFYTYAYPSPEDLANARVAPDDARWQADLGEFILPYRAVAESSDPPATLTEFLDSAYSAAARLADWPDIAVARSEGLGRPPAI